MATAITIGRDRETASGIAKEAPAGRVLILGKSRPSLQRLMEVLGQSGYEVRLADRLTAGELWDWAVPDLMLIDIVDGLAVLRERPAGAMSAEIPIIVVASSHRLQDVAAAVELGAVDYISEPLHEHDALVRVAMHVRHRRAFGPVPLGAAARSPETALARDRRCRAALARFSEELLGPARDDVALQGILSVALRHLADAMRVDCAAIFRNGHDDQAAPFASALATARTADVPTFVDAPELRRIPLALVTSKERRTLEAGRLYGGRSVELFADHPKLLQIAREHAIHSTWIIPITVHGQWWGIIAFNDRKAGRAWSDQEAGMLRTAAEIVGLAIGRDGTDRQSREDALRQHIEELASLKRIATTLAYESDLPRAADTAAGAIRTLFHASRVTIGLFDPPDGGQDGGSEAQPRPGAVVLLSRGVTRSVEDAHGQLVFTRSDTAPDDRTATMLRALQVADCATAMLVSLPAPSGSAGLLAVGWEQPNRTCTPADLALASTVASLIAGAVANVHLRRQAQDGAKVQERQRLSRALHDSVTQVLYSITLLGASWATQAANGQLEDPADKFRQLSSVAQHCHKQMRLLIYELRQPELRAQGLIRALESRLHLVERHAQIEPVLRAHGVLPTLPPDLEEQLFFVAQEALNNALKYANATNVTVDIRAEDGSIMLMVQDDGDGFDPAAPSNGLGLSTMRERAEGLGGSLSLLSAPGEGTIVEVVVPLPPQ